MITRPISRADLYLIYSDVKWGEAKSRWRVGRGRVVRGWVFRGSCLFEDKKRYILAPSVLGPNLQLPSHELISPNSFYEMLNKGKLCTINYKHFPSGLANNFGKL